MIAMRWLGWSVLVGALAGCGSKTGLKIPDFEVEPPDAGPDARVVPVDAGREDGGTIDAGPIPCVPFVDEAPLASLDLFVVLDISGSMEDTTASGETKAEAMNAALSDFVRARASEGIAVSLTFFPVIPEGVPEYCTRDRDCGSGEEAVCLMPDLCLPSGDQYCRADRDCGRFGECEPLGRCEGEEDAFCLPSMGGAGCPAGSRCVDFGYCENLTSCRARDYRRPVVPLRMLPENAEPFVEALESYTPDGGTPTSAALDATLDAARARRRENPGSKVIVLLATDGFPSACDPAISIYDPDSLNAGIPLVAELADGGARSGIETYVIGVFEPETELDARENLGTIAAAGGTEEALIVTTEEPVTDRLLAILEELRRSVRTCIYAIPAPGVLPDPAELQVRLVREGGMPIELERRAGSFDCDPMLGGFFFEETDMGERPGFAELCPASCEIAASDLVTVEMQVGCEDALP